MRLLKIAYYLNLITLAFAVFLIVMEITLRRLSVVDVLSLAVICANVYIARNMLQQEELNES